MREATTEAQSWCDVIVAEGDEPIITYRTGMVVYEESLSKGRFVGRGWNGAGFVNFYDGRIDPTHLPAPQAFWLEIDGQLLAADWEWGGCEVHADYQPIPAMPDPYRQHVIITLRHRVRPVTVRVHTGLDGTPVLTRWLEITNTGDVPAALASAFTWSGALQRTPRWQQMLPDRQAALYSVGYFASTSWGNEGAFRWFDLPETAYRIDGRYRRDRHRHPFFVLRNNATGEHYIGQLAWSGGYSFEFDLDGGVGAEGAACLTLRCGPDAAAPQRVIAPGETITAPEMHLGLTFGDLDVTIQAMHDHLRRSVIMPQPRGQGGWLESGIGPELEITVEQVNHAIDAAAEMGAEVFFIDASWYARPHSFWWNTVGDWQVDRERFPEGLAPFRERVYANGMLWGLWMDAERIGSESRVFTAHPEWLAAAHDGPERLGGLLDLTNPEAARWMEEQIAAVITEHQLDFFRLDYNTTGLSIALRRQDGYIESSFWRYYETLYAIYDRLRARFPQVIFENCAGGGGRTDIGMVRRFSHTWVTDWQIAPRSFAITNGMTMALPPEHVDRLIGGQSGHTAAEFDFQWRLLMFMRPTFGFFYPLGSTPNPLMLERSRHWLRLYRDFVRPFHRTGRIYHHTPVVETPEPHGWGVLELASADRTRAICGLFQLAAPHEPEYLLRLRGLDAGRRYRVTFDNTGQTSEIDGVMLMHQGITIRLEGALTSELLLFEAR